MQAEIARASGTTEGYHPAARAYRDGQLVCGRVEVRIGRDTDRVGLVARERRYVTARFIERLDPTLRRELTALVVRRGAAAKRIAERLAPITLVIDDPTLGRLQLVGQLQPPHLRFGELRDVEFAIRELDSQP
ncbi:MAG: hypothetical protein ACR2H2_15925 [Solirubrobacteraceae bacterium]